MNKSIFFLFFFHLVALNIAAQTKAQRKTAATITLQFVDVSEDSVSVILYRDKLGRSINPGIDTLVALPGGRDKKYMISAITRPEYLKILSAKQKNLEEIKYVLEPGDSITILISENDLRFKGRNAAKFECLYTIDTTINGIVRRRKPVWITEAVVRNHLDSAINHQFQDSLYHISVAILEKYRLQISPIIHDVILNDLYSNNKLGKISAFSFRWYPEAFRYPDSTWRQETLKNYFYKQAYPDTLTTSVESKSISYSYLQFLIARRYQEGSINVPDAAGASPSDLYKAFLKEYAAYPLEFRERLLTKLLFSYTRSDAAYISAIDDLKKRVKSDEYLKMLEQLKLQNQPHVPAYSFSLPDSSGKSYALKDFKGKVILMDFWFTGCGACSLLKKSLQPVYNRFDGNPHVAFVTISIDKDSLEWVSSLRGSQGYTNPSDLNLYTGGKGELHPLFMHYGFVGCPQLILIDKEGYIVTTNAKNITGKQDPLWKDLIGLINQKIAN